MFRHLATTAALAATFAAGLALAPAATAGNVGWNVSIGGPGFAISAGEPGYAYGRYGHGHAYGHGYGYGPVVRPYYRPFYPAYVAPLAYPAPIVYPAPVVYRAPYAPRRIVVAAPLLPPPRVVAPYGGY